MFQVHKDRLKIYFHSGITLPSIKEEPEEPEVKSNKKREYIKDLNNPRWKVQHQNKPSSETSEQSEKELSESSSTEQSDGENSKNAPKCKSKKARKFTRKPTINLSRSTRHTKPPELLKM
ncbi:unnamed protein product [Brachionus calyciflorus]|uniref:Uncharacterized protein n=1 Tax=Brachionus calyciflorus TaxID=104777 RepID=A0A814FBA8_9BILA|nr:unnamed protein product [Brachionus calyciflorus]